VDLDYKVFQHRTCYGRLQTERDKNRVWTVEGARSQHRGSSTPGMEETWRGWAARVPDEQHHDDEPVIFTTAVHVYLRGPLTAARSRR